MTFEDINKSVEKAKRRRIDALARFHIGDVCYPLYQTWSPTIWGIIVDINVTTHKISVNLNGIVRQYDPEELVLTNPEEKEPNRENEDRQRVMDEIERTVSSAFWASKTERIAKRISAANELDPKLYQMKNVNAIYNYIEQKVKPYTSGKKTDNWQSIYKIVDIIKDLGVDVECINIDTKDYRIDGGTKKWNYLVSFINVAGKKVEIYYQIVGCANGTVSDPWCAYDIIAGPTYGRLVRASVNRIAASFDEKGYEYYVVIKNSKGDLKIESGWEYPEDAKDQVKELKKTLNPKIYKRKGLRGVGLDPKNNSDWHTGLL